MGATDNCDLDVAIVCTPSVLSPGTATVVCTATDDDGNESACSVDVTVLKGPFDCQFLRPLDGNVDNRINPGRTVPVKVKVTCQNVFDDGVTATIGDVVQIVGAGTPISNEVVDDAGQSSDDTSVMRLADGFYIYNLSTKDWPDDSGARFKVVVRIAKPGHVDTLCEVILKNK